MYTVNRSDRIVSTHKDMSKVAVAGTQVYDHNDKVKDELPKFGPQFTFIIPHALVSLTPQGESMFFIPVADLGDYF